MDKLNGVVPRNHLNLDCVQDELSQLATHYPRYMRLIRQLDERVAHKTKELEDLKIRYLRAPSNQLLVFIKSLYEQIESLSKEKMTIPLKLQKELTKNEGVLEEELKHLKSVTGRAMEPPQEPQTLTLSNRKPKVRKFQNASYPDYTEESYSSRLEVSPFARSEMMELDNSMLVMEEQQSFQTLQEAENDTYCLCRQPASYDENMIACDNPAGCPIEWFHVKCVIADGKVPEGNWLCPKCAVNPIHH